MSAPFGGRKLATISPEKFYGNPLRLPQYKYFARPLKPDDKARPINALMDWALEAPWSQGGLSRKRKPKSSSKDPKKSEPRASKDPKPRAGKGTDKKGDKPNKQRSRRSRDADSEDLAEDPEDLPPAKRTRSRTAPAAQALANGPDSPVNDHPFETPQADRRRGSMDATPLHFKTPEDMPISPVADEEVLAQKQKYLASKGIVRGRLLARSPVVAMSRAWSNNDVDSPKGESDQESLGGEDSGSEYDDYRDAQDDDLE